MEFQKLASWKYLKTVSEKLDIMKLKIKLKKLIPNPEMFLR